MQTKDTLTLKPSSFGSKCELSNKFMDAVGKSGVADSILAFANFKQNKELKKTDGAKRSRLLGAFCACMNQACVACVGKLALAYMDTACIGSKRISSQRCSCSAMTD